MKIKVYKSDITGNHNKKMEPYFKHHHFASIFIIMLTIQVRPSTSESLP